MPSKACCDVQPAVTVVIPAYRAAKTIGATISSVLLQTVSELEVLVVDDGSDDETAAVATATQDPRVRVVHQRNSGVAAARNRGVRMARADLVTFCDADDVWFPRHLDAALRLVGPRGFVTSNAYYFFEGGIEPGWLRHAAPLRTGDAQRRAILEQNFVSIMSVFPKQMYDEIGPFDEGLRRAEDWDFWLRAILAGYRVAHQRQPLAMIRWGDSSLSADAEDMDRCVRAVLQKALDSRMLTDGEREYVLRRLAGPDPRAVVRDADEAMRSGRYRAAARGYATAASLVPSERRLVWKSRSLRVLPSVSGRLVGRRMRRREGAVGFSEGHVR